MATSVPMNVMLAREAHAANLRALRDVRATGAYEPVEAQMFNPATIDGNTPGIMRPPKSAPEAGSAAALKKEARRTAATGRKLVKDAAVTNRKERFPKDQYGLMTIPVPRYTAQGQNYFGLTADTANNEQLANRAFYKFSGDGAYFTGDGAYTSGANGITHMIHHGRFSGQGGFFDDIGNFFVKTAKGIFPVAKEIGKLAVPVAREIGRFAMPLIGNTLAPGIGGMIGAAAADHFLGSGAYEHDDTPITGPEIPIKYNNLINSGSIQTKQNAVIESAGDETGDLIFTHNEYIHDLTSNTLDFHTLERFEINPGVFSSFPLLSQFAQHYEEYDFIQCIFEFKSLVTDGNAAAAGSVMLCPNYNASNPNLPDKRSIENASGAVSGKVTASLFCGVECANDKTAFGGIKYVRTVDIDSAGRRMYDLGFLQIAAQGVPPGLAIGELWCRYKVRLSKLKVGGLKVPSIGSGFMLNAGVSEDQNTLFAGKCPDITHTPTAPAILPSNVIWSAGAEMNSVSITSVPYSVPSVKPYRVFEVQMGCVGGSQITIELSWVQRLIQYKLYSLTFEDTTCTIPYTINPPVYTKVTSSCVTAYDNGIDIIEEQLDTYHTQCQLVFGTPGQVGKLTLRMRVTADSVPIKTIKTGCITATTISAIRTA